MGLLYVELAGSHFWAASERKSVNISLVDLHVKTTGVHCVDQGRSYEVVVRVQPLPLKL